jgi:site-specific DNA-methyltransferase (adenine-specific)
VNLIHGECLEEMAKLPDGCVDMVMCDPPYGTTACKWDSIIPLEPMWEQLKRLIKPNGAIVMTASQPFTTTLIASNMKMFKYCWVWEKSHPSNIANAKRMVMKWHEDVCVFYSIPPTYKPQKTQGKPNHSTGTANGKRTNRSIHNANLLQIDDYSGMKHPKSIIKANNPRIKGQHPTQKPVALMEYLIKTYTSEGETVLDFTMGSGTTGVACVNLNREFIGIERDDKYFEIAKNRIGNAKTAQRDMFTEGLI